VPTDLSRAVRRIENLESAWRVIQQNGRTSKSDDVRLELEKFSEDASSNLRSLQRKLSRGTFRFEKAKGVPVPKLDAKGKKTGKFRPIVLAPVQTRIVQRAVLNVLVEIDALKPFMQTPYSFGGIRSQRRRGDQGRSERLSAVPAAIKAVLDEIGQGAAYVASADIQAFFTRISKDYVIGIIEQSVNDKPFLDLLRQAISVELENLALLREKASSFPTEDIGVAQGNSLSPILGNIALAKFDEVMNQGDCRCIRYIDDFIILAPTKKAANSRLKLSITLLSALGMNLSREKSSVGASKVEDGFDFLGINICNGLIRPSQKSRERFLSSVDSLLIDSKRAMISSRDGQQILREHTLLGTLKRLDGMIDGWGKHYWFCNDGQIFLNLDSELSNRVGSLLGCYRSVRDATQPKRKMALFGLAELASIKREPFAYLVTLS
jgi:RNA-directed DNA polymerase